MTCKQAAGLSQRKMPLSNLCSRPDVTSIRMIVQFPSFELSLNRSPRPALSLLHGTLVPRETPSCPRGRRLAVAGIVDLEWWVGLAPNPPAVTTQPPHAWVAGLLQQNSRRPVKPYARAEAACPLTLLSQPDASPDKPESRQTARAFSTRDAPNATASETPKRLPPTNPENLQPVLALGMTALKLR
jgi:hypothetical protein